MKKQANFLSGMLLAASVSVSASTAEQPPGWIAGHWCKGEGDNTAEELWLPARASNALGVSRMHRGGKLVSFEFMRIAVLNGQVTYIAQPGGGAPTAFKQTASGDNWARFENPAHDFPTRIEYRRDGDTLNAEISGPGKDGQTKTIPFVYRRCE